MEQALCNTGAERPQHTIMTQAVEGVDGVSLSSGWDQGEGEGLRRNSYKYNKEVRLYWQVGQGV